MSQLVANALPLGSKILPAKKLEKSVCICLHGYGDNATNFSELCPEIGNDFTTYICVNGILAAPFPMGRQWFSLQENYFPNLTESVSLIENLLALIVGNGGVSENKSFHSKISVMGFSQGAALSLAVGLQSLVPIDTVFALSGFMPFRHRLKIQAHALQKTRFYVTHGSQDAVLFPMHHHETLDFLNMIGVSTVEHSVVSMAHTIHPQQIQRMASLLGEKVL
jgi:phospholipase/carboxylesterase